MFTARTIAVLATFILCGAPAAQEREFVRCSIDDETSLPPTANRDYRLYVPPAMRPGEHHSLVVYLHGAGSKGGDHQKPVKEALPQFLASTAVQEKHPCFVLVPQCRSGIDVDGRPSNWVKWAGQAERLPAEWTEADSEPSDQLRGAMAALDDVLSKHPIDRTRIYLAGVSMGGSGAWYWAAQKPELFAAVVPICGLSEASKIARLKDMPIWTFHGSADETVPVKRTRQVVTALRSASGGITYTEYEGAGHNITQRVVAEPRLLPWLFAQHRAADPASAPQAQATSLAQATADENFFENKVRPVLSAHCYKCHGPEKQEGNLRLDSRAAALKGGDYRPAVVPAKPEESWLVKGIGYADEALQMPPSGKLPESAIRDLTEWVKRGAAWPAEWSAAGTPAASEGSEKRGMVFTAEQTSHWSFQPMKRPVALDGQPLAAFIDEQFLPAGQPAATLADKRTLLRRVTFDLTGLPPTPEEIAAFLADESPSSYGRVIERLLASSQYGERWGRHWLDVARYADSNGSEIDHAMANAWRYRDYVVRAFNSDKPFDRFVQEQIAGDLLPPTGDERADADKLIATGFLMLGPKALADLDKDRLLADTIDEQVDTVGRAFMGLTLGCCRCHDHKFDPLPTADYYALAGIFRSVKTIDVSKRMATWSERPLGSPADLARVESLIATIGDLRARRDAAGAAPTKRKLALAASEPFLAFEAEDYVRANVRVDRESLGKGIGVLRTLMEYPDHIEYEFELPAAGEYQLELRYAAKESRPTQISVNGNLEEMEAAAEVTGDWTPRAQRWFVQGVYQFRSGKNVLTLHRDGPVPMFDKLIVGRPSATAHSASAKFAPVRAPSESLTKQQIDAAIDKARQELEEIPTALAPLEGVIADAPILARGNPAMPGEIVPRGFPRIISGVPVEAPATNESGRRELAQWLTQPNHPLTARVIVNRVWQWHFGEGLVRSPDNFGLRGEAPSHPVLLDGLATWFAENGWSLKKLHRGILLSAAYRAAPQQQDAPDSGFPRRRLEAEEIRDAMLAASGQLDRTVGGTVMTVMNRTYANGGDAPADIVKQLHYDTPRRSLYLPVVRNAVNDFLATFDYPEPGMLTGKRATTTVAPQALFLMNSPFVKHQAAAFAERLLSGRGDDAGRVRQAYERACGRPPLPGELVAALRFIESESAAVGESDKAEPRKAALTRFCHMLFSTNEFLYVR